MSLLGRILTELRKPLSLLAAMVTVLNLGFSIPYSPQGGLPIPIYPIDNLLFSMVAFVLLVGTVTASFGWLIAALRCCGEGFIAVWLLLVSLLSAWTVLFDAQWLLTGPPVTAAKHAGLFVATSVAALLSLYFIGWFSGRMGLPRPTSTYMWQVIAFAAVYFVVALLPLFRMELYNPFQ